MRGDGPTRAGGSTGVTPRVALTPSITKRTASSIRRQLRKSAVLPVAALAVLAAAAACSSPTDSTAAEPSLLSLYVGDVHISRFSALGILPGSTLQFSVRLTDASGRAVSGFKPLLVSRNTASLTMDLDGTIRVVGRGASWIVGSVLTPSNSVLADSTLVNVVCTVLAVPAVQLTVVDSLTGQSAALRAISVSIRSGGLRDTVFVATLAAGSPPFSVGLAYERPGTYDLSVTAAGYRIWTSTGVVVTNDLCHVITVPLTARLVAQ